jgi:hypothetical protein
VKLPKWATSGHPIFQRELKIWRKNRWQIWLPFFVFPAGCIGFYWITSRSLTRYLSTSDLLGTLSGWLFGLQILFGAWLSICIIFRTIAIVAHERETQMWPLLRATSLSIAEIVSAKIAATLQTLRWPITVTLLTRAATVVLALIANYDQAGLAGLFLGALFTLIFCAELLISVIYNCAVGVTASALSADSAKANGLAYLLHFGLSLFIFLPVVYPVVRNINTYELSSTFIGGAGLFLLLILLQSALGIGLFRASLKYVESLPA